MNVLTSIYKVLCATQGSPAVAVLFAFQQMSLAAWGDSVNVIDACDQWLVMHKSHSFLTMGSLGHQDLG